MVFRPKVLSSESLFFLKVKKDTNMGFLKHINKHQSSKHIISHCSLRPSSAVSHCSSSFSSFSKNKTRSSLFSTHSLLAISKDDMLAVLI